MKISFFYHIREIFCFISTYLGIFQVIFPLLISNLIPLWSESRHCMISFFVLFCFVLFSGVELKMQLLAQARAIATRDLRHICDLHYSSWQRWILNSLKEARNLTCNLMDTEWVPNPLNHNGNSLYNFYTFKFVKVCFMIHNVACLGKYSK